MASIAQNVTALPCPIYFTTPSCNVTWAEYIGPTHDIICWAYVTITALLLLYSIFVLYSHVRRSGFRPINHPHEKPIVFCAFLTTVSLLATAADPFAYRGIYGRPGFDFLRTTTILLALMCLALMIVKWQGLLSGRLKATMPQAIDWMWPTAILKRWTVVGVSYAVTVGVWILSVFLTVLCAAGVISDNLFLVLLTVLNVLAVATITLLYGFHTILIIRLIIASKKRQQRLLAFGHSEVPGAGHGADVKRQKEESNRAVRTAVFQMRLTIKSAIIFSVLLICTFALMFRLFNLVHRYASGTTTSTIPSVQTLVLTDLGFCAFALQAGLFAIIYFSKPREDTSRAAFTRLHTGSTNGQSGQGGQTSAGEPLGSLTTLSQVNT